MLAFGERFPGHAQIVLGRNFRCRAEILDAAVACVSHNQQRTAKALIAMRGPGGHAQRARVRLRAPRSAAGSPGTSPTRSPPAIAADRDPGARPHRLRHPAGAARARARRDRAPRARQPRPLRALRGPRRARLPDAASQPGRRAGVPARDRSPRAAASAPPPPTGSSRSPATEHDGDLIAAAAARAGSTRSVARQARDRLARFGAELDAHPRANSRRPVARPRRRRDGDARRRPRPPLPAAPRPLAQAPTSAATPSASWRTCARCAAPRRPTRTSTARPPRSPGSSSTPPACTPRSSTPARTTGGSPSRRSTAPRAPKPSSSCSSPAKSSCCPPGARSPAPTPSSSPRSAGCSTSPPPAPRTGCSSPTPPPATDARPAAPRRFLTEAGLHHATERRSPPEPPPKGATHAQPRHRHPDRGARAAGAHARSRPIELLRRPFAPGAIGFRAMTKVTLNGQPVRRRAGRRVPQRPIDRAATERRRPRPLAPGVRARRRRAAAAPAAQEALPRLPADRHAAASSRAASRVDAVYEDIGEMDAGSLAGLKALYSDARKRAAVAAGIGAYLYTALAPVVLHDRPRRPPGPGDPPPGQERPARALSPRPSSGCATATRRACSTDAVRRDLGAILAARRTRDRHGPGRSRRARPPRPTQPRAASRPRPSRRRPPTRRQRADGELVGGRLRRPRPQRDPGAA